MASLHTLLWLNTNFIKIFLPMGKQDISSIIHTSLTSGSSSRRSGLLSGLRRSLTTSLYISSAENLITNILSEFCNRTYTWDKSPMILLIQSHPHFILEINIKRQLNLIDVSKNIICSILCDTTHCVGLSTACLSICKYGGWKAE